MNLLNGLGFCLAGTISALSAEGVLFAQPPLGVTAFPGSYGEFGRHQVADNFTMTAGSEVGQVQWYGGSRFIGPSDRFSIYIYSDDFGKPGTPLFSIDAGNGSPNSTGVILRDSTSPLPRNSYSAILETPFQAAANQRYWISIYNETNPNWEWELSTQDLSLGVRRRYPDVGPEWGDRYGNNAAFSLLVVPEASPIALFCAGAAALIVVRLKR